jgi:demethylmenaquinone methyltransferase / 2-methoxy-6-polyprenyl-1,4-benzoquinol methylase
MREMFSLIAPRYDFITRAFSYGMDGRWKREGVEATPIRPGGRVLDLACGTGDFSLLASNRWPQTTAIAADLTHGMLKLARRRGAELAVVADAQGLPFCDGAFDAVFVGYGFRNFPVLDKALAEIRRVTRPGGSLVSLDFFLPRSRWQRKIYLGYLFAQGAFWGTLLHGRPRTYTYIPDSLRGFLTADQMCTALGRSGWERVEARKFILGGIALHRAVRTA